MIKTRRRVALGIAAAASAASMLLVASPAQAVPLPAWPAGGYVPTGCTATGADLSPVIKYWFTDPGLPTVPSVHIGSGTSNITVLPPAGAAMTLTMPVVERCSGVGSAYAWTSHNGVFAGSGALLPPATNAFAGVWSQGLGALQGSPGAIRPDTGVGYYQVITASAMRRYDSFMLDANFVLTGTPVSGTGSGFTTGPWIATKFFALRAMTLSNALSATKVAKGKTVKATAVLKMATNAGYVADASDKVVVQTKVGTGKWISNATLTTNASGVVSYSFVLSATTQVRFIHLRVLSGKYTNAVTSVIKTVTKA